MFLSALGKKLDETLHLKNLLFTTLLVIGGALSPILNAQSEFTEEEDLRNIQWLEDDENSLSVSVLTTALTSHHYNPEGSLAFLYNTEFDVFENRFRLNILLEQCRNFPNFGYCDGTTLEYSLVEVDSDNLSPYLYLFTHFVHENDMENALESLRQGLQTSMTNDYYVEKVMFLREELGKVGFFGHQANLATELLSQNSLLSMYLSIIPTCVQQSKTDEMWKSVCLALGERLEKGSTFFSNVYGAAICRDVVSATSSNTEDILAAQKKETFMMISELKRALSFPGGTS